VNLLAPPTRHAPIKIFVNLKLGTGAILVSVVRSVEDRFRLEKNVLVETAGSFDFHAMLILSKMNILAKHVGGRC
jgi:hypothetical protein